VDEDVLPGGGVALLRTNPSLERLQVDNADQDAGITGLRHQNRVQGPGSASSPDRRTNAGEEPSIVLSKVLEAKDNFDFNAGAICPSKDSRRN
jgi:chaperonin GroEL